MTGAPPAPVAAADPIADPIANPIERQRRVARLLATLLSIGFASLIVAGIAAVLMTTRTRDHTGWVIHTHRVELAISDTRRLIEQGETTRRGYLIEGTPDFLAAYRETAAALPRALGMLGAITADNPAQRDNLALARARLAPLIAARDRTIALVGRGDRAGALAAFHADLGARQMRGIREVFDRMGAEERRLLVERDRILADSVRAFYAVVAIAGLLLVVVAVVALVTVRRFTRALATAGERLAALNGTLEARVIERTADLTRANEEIQRFAYIVSHDLRSPLVNVMGFTAELDTAAKALIDLVRRADRVDPDLVTVEAREAAKIDLPEAIGFIRTSTAKMDRLINAILTLSRQGRRTLAPEPLDLAAIAHGAADAIRHLADDRGAVITVEEPMPALVADRLAIEQMLSNLVENAIKYLDPARPGEVVVSARRAGARVVVAVADNGRGIAPADHARIFDLFRRSGAQDQPGEGIGLAHVRALAYRLGGTIDVESRLGEGATFLLSLPAAPPAPLRSPAP